MLRNYDKGISLALSFLVLLPEELFIDMGAGIPVLSVYRAIIICIFFVYLFKQRSSISQTETPLIGILLLTIFFNTFSLLFSVDFNESFKPYLSFIIESVLFYTILVASLKYEEIDGIIYSLSIATILIALIGVLERYIQFNPVDYLPVSGRFFSKKHDLRYSHLIYSTFTHPIMLGTALVMGWPMCLESINKQKSKNVKLFFKFGILLIYPVLYFTVSRGPWLGFILVSVVLLLFRFPNMGKKVLIILILTISVFIIRPGIYDTIFELSKVTADPTTLEGGSFAYRFELWKVAYNEISKSTVRFLFGYGQDARGVLNLVVNLSYDNDRLWKIRSWDNQLAATLLERGFIGLVMTLILYFFIAKYYIAIYNKINESDKSIVAVIGASIAAYMFMTTNVLMFSHQVGFFLWTNIAMLVAVNRKYKDKESYHASYIKGG